MVKWLYYHLLIKFMTSSMSSGEWTDTIIEALDHLRAAEDLVRSLGNSYLDAYVADQIDSSGCCLGKGLYAELADYEWRDEVVSVDSPDELLISSVSI